MIARETQQGQKEEIFSSNKWRIAMQNKQYSARNHPLKP